MQDFIIDLTDVKNHSVVIVKSQITHIDEESDKVSKVFTTGGIEIRVFATVEEIVAKAWGPTIDDLD